MYSDTENIRCLINKEKIKDKIKLFNNITVICYCCKHIKGINYKKHFNSKYHRQYQCFSPNYNKLFFKYNEITI